MNTENERDVWFDIPGAMEYLKVSKSTLYETMRDGRLPYYFIKGTRQRRLKRQDLDNLMTLAAPGEFDESDS